MSNENHGAVLAVKNWDAFQHYKDRSPPWLKLHRGLLDNMDYALLSDFAGKMLPLLWLVASESGGILPDAAVLAFRLRTTKDKTNELLDELLDRGFIACAEQVEHVATTAQRSNPLRYVPDKIKAEVFTRDGGRCQWCGVDDNIEYDHITPVSRGGEPTVENLQLLCRSCNRRKRTMSAEQAEQVATQALRRRSLEGETETETETEAEITNPDGLVVAGEPTTSTDLPDDKTNHAQIPANSGDAPDCVRAPTANASIAAPTSAVAGDPAGAGGIVAGDPQVARSGGNRAGGKTTASRARPCPHDDIVALYHEALPELPRVLEWNDTRRGYLRQRWRDDPQRQDLDWWRGFFEHVRKSDFLMGRVAGRGDRPPFTANLEWLVRPTNFAKIREGAYH